MKNETVIDRSAAFDQGREHDHTGKEPCWCGFGVGSAGRAVFDIGERGEIVLGYPNDWTNLAEFPPNPRQKQRRVASTDLKPSETA